MTVNEFQRKYHNYSVATRQEALDEIEHMEPVEGHLVIVAEFPGLGCCLMLDTAYQEIGRLGII